MRKIRVREGLNKLNNIKVFNNKEAIKAYFNCFHEGTPIWGMDDDEVLLRINKALNAGRKMDEDLDDCTLPPGTYL